MLNEGVEVRQRWKEYKNCMIARLVHQRKRCKRQNRQGRILKWVLIILTNGSQQFCYLGFSAFAWQLFITVKTCCVLSTISNKRTSHSGSNKYYLNGVLLTNNVDVLELGITVSGNLSYNAHINNIVARALQP